MKNKKLLIIIIVILLNIGCDQITKYIAREFIQGQDIIEVLGNFFILKYAENDGAFLSIGSDFPPALKFILLTLLPSVILISLLLYIIFNKKIPYIMIIGFCCILGGGFSNIFDRVVYNGYVTDFLNFGIGNFRTGILNFADLSIVAGAIILLFSSFKTNKKKV